MSYVEIAYRYGKDGAAQRPRPASADAARERLEEGSHAFAQLLDGLARDDGGARRVIEVDAAELGLRPTGEGEPRQHPYAAIVGCSDARVPIELIFNEGPNDLFVVRVAGNGLGSDVLGSLKYAVDHLGESLKLVVVLGHSGCGAVSAAVDVFLRPADYVSLLSKLALRGIIDRLLVVVHACAKRMAARFGAEVVTRPGYRAALIEMSVLFNAALAAYAMQQELGAAGSQELRVMHAVYVLGDREIWAPRNDAPDHNGLAAPPADIDGFVALSDAVMDSRRFTALLAAAAPAAPPPLR